MAKVMAKACQLDTPSFTIGNAQFRLGILEVYNHLVGQVGDA